jgi:hypothetical protein
MSGTKIEESSYLGNGKNYLFIPPFSMALQGFSKPMQCTCSNKQQRYTVTGESNVSLKFLVLEGRGHHPTFGVHKAGEAFDFEGWRKIAK